MIAFLIGTLIGTFIVYSFIGWILKTKRNKRFIFAGIITWLLCAALYGLGSLNGRGIGYYPLTFFNGLILYFIGSSVWPIVAIMKDKKKVNTNSEKSKK